MGEVSRHYYRTEGSGAVICFELTVHDAEAIFDHARREDNPVAYLKAAAKERTELAALKKNALRFLGLFLVFLFFLRRFIP